MCSTVSIKKKKKVRFDSHMRGFKPSEVPSHFSVALSEAALTPVQGYSNPIPALLVLLRDLFNDAGGPLRDGKPYMFEGHPPN